MPRGTYSGCLGFFSVDGVSDLNVVIRTATIDERGIAIAAGGAIVALSDASDEYEEVLLKARPVRSASIGGGQSTPRRPPAFATRELPWAVLGGESVERYSKRL